jgi:hypothetical protein
MPGAPVRANRRNSDTTKQGHAYLRAGGKIVAGCTADRPARLAGDRQASAEGRRRTPHHRAALDLSSLARFSRRLKGMAQTINLGADVFLADGSDYVMTAANYQAATTGAGQSLSQTERFNSERTDCGPSVNPRAGSFLQDLMPLLTNYDSMEMSNNIDQFWYVEKLTTLTHLYLELRLPLHDALRAAEADL